jgi:hypothetical protein
MKNNLVHAEGTRVYKCASPGGQYENPGLNQDEVPARRAIAIMGGAQ